MNNIDLLVSNKTSTRMTEALLKYKNFCTQQQTARALGMDTCFDEIVMQCRHFDYSQIQILPRFKGIVEQTALETEKPCTRYLVGRTGLLYGMVDGRKTYQG
jgi:hypothetical protein